MVTVALCVSSEGKAYRYAEAMEKDGVLVRLLTPQVNASPEKALEDVGGLLLAAGPGEERDGAADGPCSDGLKGAIPLPAPIRQRFLEQALAQNMPVLAVGQGMWLLNLAFGGKAAQPVANHGLVIKEGRWRSSHHSIYLSPGSKLAAVLGMGGFFKVNSRHQRGLREGLRSPRLLASAYSLEDGVIEGLESAEHAWVIGVQWHPERQDEVSKVFQALFGAFVERVEAYPVPRLQRHKTDRI